MTPDPRTTSCRFVTNKMCPFAQKAWIALEAADASYTIEQVSLYGAGGKPDWFWKLNPKGEVPVLVINEKTDNIILADSDLILDNISLVIGSGKQEQPALTIPSDDDSEIQAKIQAFRGMVREFLPIGKSAVLEGNNTKKMWAKLQDLDALIEGPYVVGDDVTVADCAGFPFIWRIDQEFGRWEDHGCTKIESWLVACKKVPAFKKSIQRSWWWWW